MIVEWCRQGLFDRSPAALAEALSCACILGRTEIAAFLLDRGVNPSGGAGTGMNAMHWAVNRGQTEAARLLMSRGVPLEARNTHGGTVLATAVWSAIHEPRSNHLRIIEMLLAAGARADAVNVPCGDARIDEILARHQSAS